MWLLKTADGKKIFFEDIKVLQLVLSTLHRQGGNGFIFKIKTTPIQNAIIISSMIGCLLSVYDEGSQKSKKAIDILRGRVKKFMAGRARSNKKEFLNAASYADMVWKKAIAHFAKQELQIEVVSTTTRLYALYDKELNRYANINDKQMDAFSYIWEATYPQEMEKNSIIMADFILDEISKFTGKKPKRLAFFEQKSESRAA